MEKIRKKGRRDWILVLDRIREGIVLCGRICACFVIWSLSCASYKPGTRLDTWCYGHALAMVVAAAAAVVGCVIIKHYCQFAIAKHVKCFD